jgi:SPP1 gp7 family putative phage head morphogenesis protein
VCPKEYECTGDIDTCHCPNCEYDWRRREEEEVVAQQLYGDLCPTCGKQHPTAFEPLPEDYLSDMEKAFKKTLKDLYDGKTPNNKTLIVTGSTLAKQVQDSYGQITVDYTTPDMEMLTRLVSDTWQFSAAKNYQELRDLTLALKDDNGKLREWNDFKEVAQGIGDRYNESWMRTEYDMAIASSQNAARWTEFEKEADVIPNLKYQTVGDSNVRPEHAALDGIVRPLSDPFWSTHYPPNGWGCRCEAVQSVGEPVTTKYKDISIPEMFRTNLAKTGLIYPKNHPYYNGVPNNVIRKAMAYLPPENTYLTFAGEPEVNINVMHGQGETEGNLRTLSAFLDNYKNANNPVVKVNLLPEFDEKDKELKKKFLPKGFQLRDDRKNPDAVIGFKNKDKWVVDLKYMTGKGRNLSSHIEDAYLKADYAIIKTTDKLERTVNQIMRTVNGKMTEHPDLKGVFVYDDKDKLIYSKLNI